MRRRELLILAGGLLAASGCSTDGTNRSSPSDSPSPSPATSTPTQTTTSSGTASPTSTDAQEAEGTDTRESPYTVAVIDNQDSLTHQFEFTVTRSSTGEVVFETSKTLSPGDSVEIMDEWLTESGDYEIRGETEDGNTASTRIDAESNWACDHFIQFTIDEEGGVSVSLAVGSGKQCEKTATSASSTDSDTPGR